MWTTYHNVAQIEEALHILDAQGEKARVVAGATDLMLELERGMRKGIDELVDISRIPSLDRIEIDNQGNVHLGPLVTHNHCVVSGLIREKAQPLALACWEVGSPQIRNRGTVAGNLITASPANDTITPLVALGAAVCLRSKHGERTIPLKDFYLGVRKVNMEPDEMLVDVTFPAMKSNQRGIFIKFSLRKAQAISLVNATVLLTFSGEEIRSAVITLGAVAPTIIHAEAAETYLIGKRLSEEVIETAAELAVLATRPIDDIRASAAYRKAITRVLVRRGLKSLISSSAAGLPLNPVVLWGRAIDQSSSLTQHVVHDVHTPIKTNINGKDYIFKTGQNKSLLRLLREEALLTGTKEGCSEGECGACTIFLDGKAVMSCMVPAPRAHGAEIVTVEGLSIEGKMHPIQAAFVEEDAVQCGYCTPGFLMAGAKLLEERPHPTTDEIRQAITGNLCRCTGYYNIIKAIEKASIGGE